MRETLLTNGVWFRGTRRVGAELLRYTRSIGRLRPGSRSRAKLSRTGALRGRLRRNRPGWRSADIARAAQRRSILPAAINGLSLPQKDFSPSLTGTGTTKRNRPALGSTFVPFRKERHTHARRLRGPVKAFSVLRYRPAIARRAQSNPVPSRPSHGGRRHERPQHLCADCTARVGALNPSLGGCAASGGGGLARPSCLMMARSGSGGPSNATDQHRATEVTKALWCLGIPWLSGRFARAASGAEAPKLSEPIVVPKECSIGVSRRRPVGRV